MFFFHSFLCANDHRKPSFGGPVEYRLVTDLSNVSRESINSTVFLFRKFNATTFTMSFSHARKNISSHLHIGYSRAGIMCFVSRVDDDMKAHDTQNMSDWNRSRHQMCLFAINPAFIFINLFELFFFYSALLLSDDGDISSWRPLRMVWPPIH